MEMRAHHGQTFAASGLDILAGIWLIISPWVLAYAQLGAAASNAVVLGIIIALLACARFFGGAGVWASWLNFILGIWVLISPWVIGYAYNGVATRNAVIMGIIVLLLAFWSAVSDTGTTTGMHHPGAMT